MILGGCCRSWFVCPKLLHLSMKVGQFVFQEVGTEDTRGTGEVGNRCDSDPVVTVRLWKNTSDATPSAWLWRRPLLNHPSVVFLSSPHEIIPVPLTCCCKSSVFAFCHFRYLPLGLL